MIGMEIFLIVIFQLELYQSGKEVKLKNVIKEWLIISTIGYVLVAGAVYLQHRSGHIFMLLLYPAVALVYLYSYIYLLKPLYAKLGIPPYLNGDLDFSITNIEYEKILKNLKNNPNYQTIPQTDKFVRFIRTNKNPIFYNGESFTILPVLIEFLPADNDTIHVHLKTGFGFSFIDHHGRYFLVQQELLDIVKASYSGIDDA